MIVARLAGSGPKIREKRVAGLELVEEIGTRGIVKEMPVEQFGFRLEELSR